MPAFPDSNQPLFSGAGLGLRRGLMDALLAAPDTSAMPDFLELAPENWIGIGGRFKRGLATLAERYPISCHGLALSLGSLAPLDMELLKAIREFLARYQVSYYSEHLSFCSDEGHFHDLLPIPFTEEAVAWVSERIGRAQDYLGRRIALENPSWYYNPAHRMSEQEFLCAVVASADCDILLDINNLYVNSVNHHYDAEAFLLSLPAARISGYHLAGHYRQEDDFCIDSHGAPVIGDVWALLARAYACVGIKPTLLERDFNLPPLDVLLDELAQIRDCQRQSLTETQDAIF